MQFTQTTHEVILTERGVYKVAPLYHLDGYLYAKYGSGFIGLYKKDAIGVLGTTKVGVTYKLPGQGLLYHFDKLTGRMMVPT